MRSKPAAVLLCSTLGTLTLGTLTLGTFTLGTRAADFYALDTGATQVGFDVDRFGLRWVTAQFHSFRGDFVFDRDGANSRVDVVVQTDSIDCSNSLWNPHLRSPEWLDTQQYPQMVYRSHHIQFEGDDHAEASGDLTLHGVTHPMVLDVSNLRCSADSSGAVTCRFTAHAIVRRSDYGLPHGFWVGGDQVEITITGVGTRAALPMRESALE
jgi:polyisoprenoid-binding protein YceI